MKLRDMQGRQRVDLDLCFDAFELRAMMSFSQGY
jgi:hypothetical protein